MLENYPLITSIGTTDGLNSVLTVEADDIGKIERHSSILIKV